MKLLIIAFLLFSCTHKNQRKLAAQVNDGGYCISLRGNGQAIAAHWGVLARAIESYGLPVGMMGGSSSTHTMFLVESILLNPYLSQDPLEAKNQASLLIKSFIGQTHYLTESKFFKKAKKLADDDQALKTIDELLAKMDTLKDGSKLKKVFTALDLAFQYVLQKRVRDITYLFKQDETQFLLNQELFVDFLTAPDLKQELEKTINDSSISDEEKKKSLIRFNQIISFRKDEYNSLLKSFGSFDLQKADNIFFIPGPLSFLGLAKLVNRIANFYAGYGHTDPIKEDFENFLQACSEKSVGKTWSNISKECKKDFRQLVSSFMVEQLANEKGHKSVLKRKAGRGAKYIRTKVKVSFPQRLDDLIGKDSLIIATTGVLIGPGAEKFKKKREEYKRSTDASFSQKLLFDEEDLKVGYWAKDNVLSTIEKNLQTPFTDPLGRHHDFTSDLKSSLFYPLYHANWAEVLATSPAEPGLTGLKSMPRRDDIISIGGWMDHLSGAVLKSSGCHRVLSLANNVGHGTFSTGVAKKILGLEQPTWDELPAFAKKGSNEDQSSFLGRYYNIANPDSSFNLGLRTADAIICGRWEHLSIKNGLSNFFESGYNSPITFHPQVTDPFLLNHTFKKVLTVSDRNNQNPSYRGCFPKKY